MAFSRTHRCTYRHPVRVPQSRGSAAGILLIRRVSRSAIVPFSADDIYALVADIESYPEFLPWCSHVEVHCRDDKVVEATLELHRAGLKKRFRTRNTLRPNVSMNLSLVDGPFRAFSGGWTFTPLGDTGSKVALDLEFEFSNRALDLMIGAYFEETCNSLVDAFVERAHTIYNKASS